MSFLFYIEREDGVRIEWTHLTRADAIKMNRITEKSVDHTVKRFGWKEMT